MNLNSGPNLPIQSLELEYPEGQVPLDSLFYVERTPIESHCYQVVLKPGSLLRIKAPKLMGKTSLMTRTLHHVSNQGYATVHLNLGEVELAVLADMDKFLRWFCLRVGKQLSLENRFDDYWDADLMSSTSNCTDYFEGYLLSELDRPLVLGLDEVDQIFPYNNTAADFFRMLRNWHEKGKNQEIWRQLRLVISHSTEAYIRLHTNSSPFNVGVPVQLPEFTPEQVENLAKRHSLNWTKGEVEQLMAMVGGHPYLIRLAMYQIARQGVTLNQLIQDPPTDEGIYGNHLRRHWDNLQQNPKLADALKRIMTSPNPVKVERTQGHKLHSMGLIKWQGAHAAPSCDLYRQYFSR
ncbi:MAG: AAA-like domain-containing protein [Pseudanabaenales cyanobacterium]|nr:AAA-like domain-containing protein [Pseudanabaenales cyanobacterium]